MVVGLGYVVISKVIPLVELESLDQEIHATPTEPTDGPTPAQSATEHSGEKAPEATSKTNSSTESADEKQSADGDEPEPGDGDGGSEGVND